MGDGLVLESGTHNDLIKTDGAYARLVQAQKLREGHEISDKVDSDSGSEDSEHDTKKKSLDETPLGRKSTGPSLASEILERRRRDMAGQNEEGDDYGLFYLFKRMSLLVRDQWKNYFLGGVFACRTFFIFHIYFYLTYSSHWNGIPRIWDSVRQRYRRLLSL